MTDTTTPAAPRPGGSSRIGSRSVSRIGYGAMQLDRLRKDRPTALAILRRAVELGVDHVDTAQFYGDGFVNDLIREAVSSDEVTIVTKIGADPVEGGPVPMRLAQRPDELRASVHTNLRALGLERIPVVNLRRMDVGPKVEGPPEQDVDIDDQLAEMVALRDEGLIGGIGLSSVSLDVLRHAVPAGIACVQNAYSLLDRSDEELLRLCLDEGIAWVPYFPLGSAFPGIPKVTDAPAVVEAAARVGATPSQVGLAWLLQHSENTLLIPGTSSLAHLETNLAVGDVELDADTVAELDNLGVDTRTGH